MSVNKHRPHVYVLPEDDANRQIANGFLLCCTVNLKAIQVLPIAGGWRKVIDRFQKELLQTMISNSHCHVVLVIDFDGKADRLQAVTETVPLIVRDRVFVIGLLTQPEDVFSAGLPIKEKLGEALANECFQSCHELWNHKLLAHNTNEVKRMSDKLRNILFALSD
jgi:hypothetical protein